MNEYLFVDADISWVANLGIQISPKFIFTGKQVHIWYETICSSVKNSPNTIVCINIHKPYNLINKTLQDCMGLHLFRQLRLNGMENHVVLYGPLPLHWVLKKDAAHAIINTKGCTYLSISSIADLAHPEFYKELAELENFKSVLRRGAYNIEAFRHKRANIWAIDKMIDCYNACYHDNSLSTCLSKDKEAKAELKEAKSLFKTDYGDEGKALTCMSMIDIENLRKIAPFTKVFYFDDQHSIGWSSLFSAIFGYENPCKNDPWISYNDAANKPGFWVYNGSYSIFDEMTNLSVTNPIIDKIRTEQPDLIILDLRLTASDQTKKNKDLGDISGFKLFKLLNKEFPGIPVLIISASDKAYTYQDLLQQGAADFWIKEGVELMYSMSDSMNNFRNLLQKLIKLTNLDYRCRNLLFSLPDKINDDVWFCKDTPMVVTIPDYSIYDLNDIPSLSVYEFAAGDHCENVKEIINKAAKIIDNALKMGNVTEVYSAIMNLLGQTVEIIHETNVSDKDFRPTVLSLQRGDYCGKILYDLRNFASHRQTAQLINPIVFYTFINYFIQYVLKKEFELSEGDVFIKTKMGVTEDQVKNKKHAFKLLRNWPHLKMEHIIYSCDFDELKVVKIKSISSNKNYIIEDYLQNADDTSFWIERLNSLKNLK